jgi:serine/threonine protein kinase
MEDHRLVQLALDNRVLTMEQVDKAKKEQQALADRGVERGLWFLLLEMGCVTDVQARDLRKYVSSTSIRALEVEGYVLQGRIGSGGMGDVFRAANAQGEEAAVKLLSSKLAKNAENARRFQREARASMRLKHPHITQSLAAGEVEGQRYLVMELVKGPSLKQRMTERGKVPEDQAIIILWQVSMALKYAWDHGVLHRDVKPANLMLAPPRPNVAEPFCAKICDFGLAKVIVQGGEPEEESKGMLTGAGMALGTPHYMPPEQASGETDLDQRADIYSLAASIYHALLGQTMHHGKSSTIIMYKQVTESADLEPLRQVGAGEGLIKLMSRMLEKNRKRRYNTWDEVLKLLAPGVIKIQQDALNKTLGSAAHTMPATSPSSESTVNANVAIANTSSRHDEPGEKRVIRPTVRIKAKAKQQGLVVVVAAGVLAIIGAVGWWISGTGDSGQRVSPATFAVVLASAGQQQRTLILEPGDYPGPWRFGVAHAGVIIRAAGPGVRVSNTGLATDVPLVRCEPGLANFSISGVELIQNEGVAIEGMAGAKATFDHCLIHGNMSVNGAQIVIDHAQVQGSVVVNLQGMVTINDSTVQYLPALVLRDGRASLNRSRFIGKGAAAGAIIHAISGQLDCYALELISEDITPSAEVVGLRLESGIIATVRDVAIRGVHTGMVATNAQIPAMNGISIYATNTGLRWQGAKPNDWQWERLLIQAPTEVSGITLVAGSEGARLDRLGLIPTQGMASTR